MSVKNVSENWVDQLLALLLTWPIMFSMPVFTSKLVQALRCSRFLNGLVRIMKNLLDTPQPPERRVGVQPTTCGHTGFGNSSIEMHS